MSVAFPVGVGLALVIGTVQSYIQTPKGDATLLFAGVALIVVAMINSAKFPNVALNSAPAVDPIFLASCSVLAPIQAASGSTARQAKMNSQMRFRCVTWRKIAIGIVAWRSQLAARFTRGSVQER